MDIKTFLDAANKLEKIEHNINIDDNLLTMQYSLMFNKISIRVSYIHNDYFFELRLNQEGDMELDLTEEKELIKYISPDVYKLIINKIFNENI